MPILMTEQFKGKELYFDLRPGGKGEPEGFWAVGISESKRQELARQAEAKGKSNQTWMDLLVYAIKRWEGFVDLAGEEVPCTEDNIRMLCDSDHAMMLAVLNMVLEAARSGQYIAEKN